MTGVLLAMVAINLPELASNPWPFRPGTVDPQGPLAPLVRAAGEEWDVGIARSVAFLAALLCAAACLTLLGRRARSRESAWPPWAGVALILVVGLMLLAPSTLLQVGLRDSTAPWFFTNDSVYQTELAGELVWDGEMPYGHDYRGSGLERFYTYDGSVSQRVLEREPVLDHLPYFPGVVYSGAAWDLMPDPLDDYRLLVLLCTLALLGGMLAFRAPLEWRLAIGAFAVCNPIAVRSAWFGQNDAPSILLLVLAFAFVVRRRPGWAGAALAAAVLLKQFALVAIPFIAVMLVKQRLPEGALRRAALGFGGVIAAGLLPFLVLEPVALWEDTVEFMSSAYRIVGYGLSGILLRLGILEDREGEYPFLPIALVTWLPLTAWLLVIQWRARELWVGAVGFSISLLVLLFVGRTFHNYYLVWPLMGAAVAALIAAGENAVPFSRASPSSSSSPSAPSSLASPSPASARTGGRDP